jgi:hypothetical protein
MEYNNPVDSVVKVILSVFTSGSQTLSFTRIFEMCVVLAKTGFCSALHLHPRDPPAEVRLQLRVADGQVAPLQAAGHERPVGVLDQLVGERLGRLGVLLGERLDAP